MNGPEWAFPTVQSLHFIAFALSLGTIVIVDLRLLGLVLQRQKASELAANLHRWTVAGILIVIATGTLMFCADPFTYHVNPSFIFKMRVLAAAILFHFTIHRKVVEGDRATGSAKVVAMVSLLLWSTVVVGGRFIAFI